MQIGTTAALLKRLSVTSSLDEEDIIAIKALPLTATRRSGNETIVKTGDRPSACCLIVDGFVIRTKSTMHGDRQILAIHQPGDIPDLQSLHLHVLDHEVSTLGECVLGFIAHEPLRQLIRNRPNVAEVLWRDTLVDAAIFREWIVNVGQRQGDARIAHLILELYTRLQLIGRTENKSFHLPLTQVQLGEATGMTSVHVNRIIQQLRRDDLLEFAHGTITIKDEARLRDLAEFDPIYLHLNPGL